MAEGEKLVTRVEILEAALENIARGPLMPPPDPGAHSWQAWGNFWRSQAADKIATAGAALTKSRAIAAAEADQAEGR